MNENRYDYYLEHFVGQLPLGESFDLIERKIQVGGRHGSMFFVDGLTDGEKCQLFLNFLMAVPEESMENVRTADDFMEKVFPFLTSTAEEDVDTVIKQMYSGLVAILFEGMDKIIVADARRYPQRSVSEPEKEKTLRGAKDGFTENFMDSLGLIRRRIRDNRLIFKSFVIGEKSRTDVALCYIKGTADTALVKRIEEGLSSIKVDSVSMADQTIVELLAAKLNGGKSKGRFNPFPKVRYTQRPDVVAAHITEGKLAIIVDNSPTVVLIPVGIFDFSQDADDYYFPLLTGNYMRLLRILNMILILVLSPIYLLVVEQHIDAPLHMDFIVPQDPYALPIFWQFILLEIAIDGLKLASLNTPESLGTSLSVIGALILGQFSIDAGWFIPQTILVMAVVALASFTQPSIELSYGIKFVRVIMLTGCFLLGIWGLIGGAVIGLIVIATTKTISGHSYLYPLIPFNGPVLKKLFFRTTK